MRKVHVTAIIILAIGLAMCVAGAILLGFTFGGYNIVPLANVMRDLGFLTAVFSGIVLVGTSVAAAIDERR